MGSPREPRVRCAAVDPLDPPAVVALARRSRPSWSSSGPRRRSRPASSDALTDGRDRRSSDRRAAAARIESRKAFCREVADAAGVPMARGRAFARDGPVVGAGLRDGHRAGRGGGRQGRRARGRQGRHGLRDARRGGRRDRRTAGRDRRRGAPARAARRASSRSATDGTRSRCPASRDHKRLGDGDTRPEHRRHGRLLAAVRPPGRGRRRDPRAVPSAGPRRAGAARHAVPWRALRRPDAHRRRPASPRVQRPVRRSGDAGDPAASRVAARSDPPGRRSRGARRRSVACRPCRARPSASSSRRPATRGRRRRATDRGHRRRRGRGRARVPRRLRGAGRAAGTRPAGAS